MGIFTRSSRDAAVSVTDAPKSHSEDLNQRLARYLVLMGIRVVCFVAALLVDGWLRWVLFTGAVVLPYIAVVLVNARAAGPGSRPAFVSAERPSLPGPPGDHPRS